MKKGFVGYARALRIVEKWNIESGCRAYCAEVCRGNCCEGCYGSDHACHRTDGRRLSCSAYLCTSLCRKIKVDPEKYWEAQHHLLDAISDANRNVNGQNWKNSYFDPHTPKMRRVFRVPLKDLAFFLTTQTEPIRVILCKLRRRKL